MGEPHFSISLQAGTGIETRWTYYYSVVNDMFSDVFYSIFQQKGNRIIYRENDTIIVRDIFDKDVFLQVFKDFEGMSQNTVAPFVSAEFTDDGRKVCVTYLDENFDEIVAIFDLAIAS